MQIYWGKTQKDIFERISEFFEANDAQAPSFFFNWSLKQTHEVICDDNVFKQGIQATFHTIWLKKGIVA